MRPSDMGREPILLLLARSSTSQVMAPMSAGSDASLFWFTLRLRSAVRARTACGISDMRLPDTLRVRRRAIALIPSSSLSRLLYERSSTLTVSRPRNSPGMVPMKLCDRSTLWRTSRSATARGKARRLQPGIETSPLPDASAKVLRKRMTEGMPCLTTSIGGWVRTLPSTLSFLRAVRFPISMGRKVREFFSKLMTTRLEHLPST
mmetsp:Transcript_8562/g.21000  ORF Transcript_8562/g.21000 Transcript_8562/m.21000 type:complete len:205 (+) Transcript_8562:665-1279(+)